MFKPRIMKGVHEKYIFCPKLKEKVLRIVRDWLERHLKARKAIRVVIRLMKER